MKREDAEEVVALLLEAQGVSIDALGREQAEYLALVTRQFVEAKPLAMPVRSGCWSGYYLAAREPQDLAGFREHVEAFCGTGFASLEIDGPDSLSADPVVALLRHVSYQHVVRLRRDVGVAADVLRTRLQDMHKLLDGRPVAQADAQRPLRYLLRDFEWAAAEGDPVRLEQALEAIAADGGLSEDNLRFAQVRKYAVLRDWHALWATGLMEYLLAVRRPARVTDLLLAAVWYRYFEEHREDVTAMLQVFQEKVRPAYGALLTGAGAVSSVEGRRVVGLYLADDPSRRDLLDELSLGADDGPLAGILNSIGSTVLPAPVAAPLDLAKDAIAEAQYDRAYALLVEIAVQPEEVGLLIQAAFNLSDTAYALGAVRAFERLTEESQRVVSSDLAMARMMRTLKGEAAAVLKVSRDVPTSWQAWLAVLIEDPAWTEAAHVAREGAAEWAPESMQDVHAAESFYEQVMDAPDEVRVVVVEIASHLHRFAERMPEGQASLWMLKTVLDVLLLDEASSVSELLIAAQVLDRLLALGPDPETYRQLLADAESLWQQRLSSYENLDWALGVVDSLARCACGDDAARTRFLSAVSVVLHRSSSRLLPGELAYARALYAECGAEDLLADLPLRRGAETTLVEPGEQRADPWGVLAGRRIGIHCLYEPITVRFRAIIPDLVADVRIESDASHDCSPHLRAMCSSSDLIVLVTQHAKHAATDCVTRNTAPGTPVVRSRSSRVGFTGVYRALQEHLEEAASARRAPA